MTEKYSNPEPEDSDEREAQERERLRKEQEDLLDEQGKESFPASDPPAN